MLIQVVNQETAIQDFVGWQNLCYAIYQQSKNNKKIKFQSRDGSLL